MKFYFKILLKSFVLLISFCCFASYENKKVLVTGGYGFIGSHLVEALVARGAHVTVLDNMSSGKKGNLVAVADRITYIEGDICNLQDCLDAALGQDIIFHLAAQVSVVDSLKNPECCFKVNVQGMWNVLEAARMCNVQRFVFSSSAAVYGNKEGLCSEEDVCTPSSAYGLSKYIGEQLLSYYCGTYGLLGISLRYFNAYGARQDFSSPYSGVVAKFQQLLREDKPLIVFGDGLQTRDFVPVEDIVAMNMMAALLDSTLLDGQACNVATGRSITLLELIDSLCDSLQRKVKPELIFMPARAGEIRHSKACCKKINQLKCLFRLNA